VDGGEGQWRTTARSGTSRGAIDWILKWLTSEESGDGHPSLSEIEAVGHRVVHGGSRSRQSVLMDESVLKELEDHIELAPLHMPYNLAGVRAVRDSLGAVPQAAVFDTAFHSTLPETVLPLRHPVLAVPAPQDPALRVPRHVPPLRGLPLPQADRHQPGGYEPRHAPPGQRLLGVRHPGGNSVDTSMGFTPLEGLVMGTRSGDVDPAVLDYISVKEGLDLRGVENLLNKQSGLLGISG
jgi:acetate kinase